MNNQILPRLASSWSGLTWQQLCVCWQVKARYGNNADVARAAALLKLTGLEPLEHDGAEYDNMTGERVFLLKGRDGTCWKATPREVSHLALRALKWFDYPYGDPGEPAEKDAGGKVVKEGREGVKGYVGPMRDALQLPIETLKVGRRHFSLPQVACNNFTWQQYRSLQGMTPLLFQDDQSADQTEQLHAQFLAHCLVPRSVALLDTAGGSIRLRPHYEYRYNMDQADGFVGWWKERLHNRKSQDDTVTLFHVCFQCYQTALAYYEQAYYLLFHGDSKQDVMRDALQGEVGTVNSVMKYAGYADQQQVYDSPLPFVLDILNTMTKEAKEIERMNAKIKKK